MLFLHSAIRKQNRWQQFEQLIAKKQQFGILNFLNQMTGINFLIFYSTKIFETLELSKELIQLIDNYLGLTSEMVNHYD